jgi:hypothetical protein
MSATPSILAEHPYAAALHDYVNRGDKVSHQPAELRRAEYIRCIRRIVHFFRNHQNGDGAIIDPFFLKEWHYSSPCYALAAALLVSTGEEDLRDSAEKALEHSARLLSEMRTPQQHADFFPLPLLLADELLTARGLSPAAKRWRASLDAVDPEQHYLYTDRKREVVHNWNAINLSGEYLRHRAGLGGSMEYCERHLKHHQLVRFESSGLYLDGEGLSHPLGYDVITRYHLAVMLAKGYQGESATRMREFLRKGALTSLFIQSPCGEWPGVGRSAHHQWNDAALAATYEWAAGELQEECPTLAAACRRGAQLALHSVERWQRSGGDLHIVRNRFEPEERQGHEYYSIHTTYNLWTAAALAAAHIMCGEESEIAPLPSEAGSYVIELDRRFHQVIAANRGYYIQFDTYGSPTTDPTGLLRINRSGCNPQIGPSEGCVANPQFAGIGGTGFLSYAPSWRDRTGEWHSLASIASWERGSLAVRPAFPELETQPEKDGKIAFTLRWRGSMEGLRSLRLHYEISSGGLEVTYEIEGACTGLRAEFPLFHFDGEEYSRISRSGQEIEVKFRGSTLSITVPSNDAQVHLGEIVRGRTGLLRRGWAETEGHSLTFRVALESGSAV